MSEFGLTVRHDTGGKRVELECEHQNGLLYVVPGDASWVCSEDLLHVHAIAGFMKQLVQLGDPQVDDLMRRWGLYFRERPLASQEETEAAES